MGKELVISATRHETKVAVLEDDQLVEIYFQRANEYSLAGSIHKGRVTRVLPGMQSAFVDIGLERDAFLYVSDFFEENEEYDKIAGAEERPAREERPRAERTEPAAAPPPAAAAPAAPAVSAVPAEAPAPAPSARTEAEGDRRGRRSRRRRARTRGFPESKYAADVTPQHPEPEPEPAPAPSAEFSVLPGESLAKYRHSSDEGPEDSGSESEPALGSELNLEPGEAEQVGAEPEMAPAVIAAEEAREEQQEADGEEEAPETASAQAEALAEEASETEAAETEETPAAPVIQAESQAEAAPEDIEEEEAVNGYPPLASEFEDESAEPEPETAEETEVAPEAEASTESEASESEDVLQEPQAGEVEPARMPVSLTATLREQGYRYPRRVSRRMRRKMRAGGYAEPRGEERHPEAARAVEEPSTERAERQEGQRTAERTARVERPPQPSITELLREGQEILVQIAKEPLGQKGARITSHIALPGRYVVYMPTVEHLGVSRKIASDEERLRLKRILQAHRAGMSGGFIVRTAGEGKTEAEIASDMQFLYNLWLDIRQKSESRPAPALIHHDLDLVHRILRDQMTETFKTVWVDSEEVYESVLRFVQRFQPSAVGRVKLYTRDTPVFDVFNVSSELEKALRPKVWLKSGGYIVINQTEALVAIDVNTGKFVGKSNRLEDTIVKTNTEAVKEIVRQIRLRDLGGIIVVDFIDMGERKNRQKVMQALEDAMRADRAPNKILQFNDFGLVAITRKRVKQSLERTLCAPCPYCEGSGYVKSVQTIVGEILQEAHKIAKLIESKDVSLRVHPEVAKFLKSSDNNYLEELEEVLGRSVIITSDPTLQQEKFDLI